jgi:hypothetical protein
MGYGMQIPAHRVGGPKKLWDFRVYGLSESWVKRVPTVSQNGRHISPRVSLWLDRKLNVARWVLKFVFLGIANETKTNKMLGIKSVFYSCHFSANRSMQKAR